LVWQENWPHWWIPPEGTDLDAEAAKHGFAPLVFRQWVEKNRKEVAKSKEGNKDAGKRKPKASVDDATGPAQPAADGSQ
jgi:hypothetical protein